MSWTHDYGDTTHEHRPAAASGTHERAGRHGHDPRLGISRILRRRARWVSARLRHPRT
ncbi:hypothetical protein [Streptomyces xanthophaeus]|uniref:hypothetical protein n=1 Tax=Streptomyces xanthophaeus TaxID=67385 RepID=UPI000A4122D3|nr:hypothetical protein [Streptomyces xanthophaeus]WST23272.1 hypothetical protein OG264_18270 [Streptomyces xanthophaeus]WST61751.1 hypothetical protein OG605_20165 [Streptomyces xanthophaeus]